MRNFIAVLGLAIILLGGCGKLSKSPKGLDIADCALGEFGAVHVKLTPEGFQTDAIAKRPGLVVVLKANEGASFKLKSSDKQGQHYVDSEDATYEVVLNGTTGTFSKSGQLISRLYVFADDDGSKLDANARAQFQACAPIIEGVEGAN